MSTFYVFSVNTSKGTTEEVELSTWNGPGTRLPGSPSFTTRAAGLAWISKNPNAPICAGYFNVPEGEAGKITNTLSQFVSTLNPTSYSISTSGIISFFGSLGNVLQRGYNTTVSEVKNSVDDVDNTTTIVTTIYVTNCAQIAVLKAAGVTQYQTQSAASTAAGTQNAGYTGTGSPISSGDDWEQAIVNFLNAVSSANLWVRAAKIIGGGALLIVGVAKLTGADAKVGGALAKATKIAPLL